MPQIACQTVQSDKGTETVGRSNDLGQDVAHSERKKNKGIATYTMQRVQKRQNQSLPGTVCSVADCCVC